MHLLTSTQHLPVIDLYLNVNIVFTEILTSELKFGLKNIFTNKSFFMPNFNDMIAYVIQPL